MMKRRDVNEIAFDVVQRAIGRTAKNQGEAQRKAEAAELGRRGGQSGGKARNRALTPARRSEIARLAAVSRWGKKRG